VEEAGGTVIELDGKPLVSADRAGRRVLAACNAPLRDELRGFIERGGTGAP